MRHDAFGQFPEVRGDAFGRLALEELGAEFPRRVQPVRAQAHAEQKVELREPLLVDELGRRDSARLEGWPRPLEIGIVEHHHHLEHGCLTEVALRRGRTYDHLVWHVAVGERVQRHLSGPSEEIAEGEPDRGLHAEGQLPVVCDSSRE